ncbi:MAG: hypothetical protein GXY44_14495 [Phycisphaerales bacterium]|nr:hypothetical protein [Phycisphaerales bacterium]
MTKVIERPHIRLASLGSVAKDAIALLSAQGLAGTLELARQGVGPRYTVTTNRRLIEARQSDEKGGRLDDNARAREVETILADDRIAALVTLRGGGWFTRILDKINFDVLRRRRKTIHIFGFSEMTSLVNIAGRYPRAVGLYDLGPAFLIDCLTQKALRKAPLASVQEKQAGGRRRPSKDISDPEMCEKASEAFRSFFSDVGHILDGQGSRRSLTGRLLFGTLPKQKEITVVGGNLSVVMPLLASPFAKAVDTKNRWLALEDVNESPSSIDRMLAGLRLAGLLERVEGILLGDFHSGDTDLNDAAWQILKRHLPTRRKVPVVALKGFGHIHPIAPLPVHRPITLRCTKPDRGRPRVHIEIPWNKWTYR